MNFNRYKIAAIIPAYRVEHDIKSVLSGLPAYIRHIIVVEDASPDSTADLVTRAAKKDKRIILIRHLKNKGVGGAMISGFRKALELGAQVAVKLDGDDQMDPAYLPALLTPLLQGKADYTKGNRFHDFVFGKVYLRIQVRHAKLATPPAAGSHFHYAEGGARVGKQNALAVQRMFNYDFLRQFFLANRLAKQVQRVGRFTPSVYNAIHTKFFEGVCLSYLPAA